MSKRTLTLLGAMVLCSSSCDTPSQQAFLPGRLDQNRAPDKRISDKPIDLTLRAELRRKNDGFDLVSGQMVHPGDRVAFFVALAEPGYVYAGIQSSVGERGLFFPISMKDQTPLTAGAEHRIPEGGRWLELRPDQARGEDDIFVYASRRLLTGQEVLVLLKDDVARRYEAPLETDGISRKHFVVNYKR